MTNDEQKLPSRDPEPLEALAGSVVSVVRIGVPVRLPLSIADRWR